MTKNYLKPIFIILCSALLISCAVQKSQTMFKPCDFNQKLKAGQYVPKADNFLIVLDASQSMNESYKGNKKINLAKDIASRMNRTIPDMKINAGLRSFGQTANPFKSKTTLLYGVTQYDPTKLEAALQTVSWASGNSPLSIALDAAGKDFDSVQGKLALIVVSDGKEMDDTPVASAKAIKNKFGDRICIYTILVGNNPAGKNLMESIANAGGCGFSVNADQIYSSEDMADFVEKVFLAKAVMPMDNDGDGVYDQQDMCPDTPAGVNVTTKGCPMDTDGDGVFDYLDNCPNTPYGTEVDAKGCPLDSDGDGVYDSVDKCPGTPVGAGVDSRGCWVLKGVFFDTGKSTIKSVSYPILDEVVSIMKKNPGLKVEVQGHTDNRGAAQYNQKLSENRAHEVMKYIANKGVEKDRLTFSGYGFSKPAASNSTPEGRAQNRRVELKPIP